MQEGVTEPFSFLIRASRGKAGGFTSTVPSVIKRIKTAGAFSLLAS